jgi:hypothetical protein
MNFLEEKHSTVTTKYFDIPNPVRDLIFIHILLRIILKIICSDPGDPSFFHRKISVR